jgi:hypothetical protein
MAARLDTVKQSLTNGRFGREGEFVGVIQITAIATGRSISTRVLR